MTLSAVVAGREVPTRTALVLPGGARLSYAEVGDRVARVASVLASGGAGPGARVALWGSTREAMLFTMLALIELGATLVPVHPRLTAVAAESLIRAATPVRLFLEDDLDELMGRAQDEAPMTARSAIDPGSALAILHTSGTTGRPKGAVLSRGAFVASATASAENLGFRDDDRWLLAMPLCHVGGLSIVTRCVLARGAIVLHECFDEEATLAAIDRDGVTLLSLVPTMLRRLLEVDRSNLLARARAILVGGAACPTSLLEECARRGVPSLTTYGLTEACAQVTCQRPRDAGTAESGCGAPLAGTSVRCVDGRIQVRGPTMMDGYLGMAPLHPGAWFDTGDLGNIDDQGRLHVHARRLDLIVTGGENVYPAEVEAALESCAGVRRAFVFGIPDPEWGELVACAIERDPSRAASEPELFLAMSRVLATHKRPRRVCFVETLPMAGDKLDRSAGKQRFAAEVRAWQRRP